MLQKQRFYKKILPIIKNKKEFREAEKIKVLYL